MTKAAALQAKIEVALKAESQALYVPTIPSNARSYGCSVPGCTNRAYAKGMCNAHYIRARKGKPLDHPLRHKSGRNECTACGSPIDAKGGWSLCKQHYRARRRRIIRDVCAAELGGLCTRCGESFPSYVFDFHHASPDKEGSPSNMADNASIRAIAQEVSKCTLLCANCHRIEHHGLGIRDLPP